MENGEQVLEEKVRREVEVGKGGGVGVFAWREEEGVGGEGGVTEAGRKGMEEFLLARYHRQQEGKA